MLAAKLLAASGTASKLYAEDVFSAYTYTGNGSTQTITNGIDLSGSGGMVWTKDRTAANDPALIDTSRGAGLVISSAATYANQSVATSITSFNSNGYSLGASAYVNGNSVSDKYVSWTFRKAPKFFDVVTYTGDGVAGRQIPHSLGIAPGMIGVKRLNSTGDWLMFHKNLSQPHNKYLMLNSTSAELNYDNIWGPNGYLPTATEFTLGAGAGELNNINGATYVAYLFAHDTGTDGLIQCGSYTGNGSATGPVVTLGYEPQYLLIKDASAVNSWYVMDQMRNIFNDWLVPNTSAAEVAAGNPLDPTATGFEIKTASGLVNTSGNTYIYLAIRRPNKPPTTGTQVYNAIARTGTDAAATVTGVGFAPDLVWQQGRDNSQEVGRYDRLRGPNRGLRFNTDGETSSTDTLNSFLMDGFSLGTGVSPQNAGNTAGMTFVNWCFKRAPGVFDVVCYTGTGVARTVAHNLGVVPEFMIVKNRNNAAGRNWMVYHSAIGANKEFFLNNNGNASTVDTTYFNNTTPTTSVFSVGTANATNQSTDTFVAYLFATLAGISKVGSYTGNGSSQTIACGFTTGARFILIKRTDSTGDWFVWDTTRGIVAGNDPHLSLNTTAAEVTTDDSIDPDTSGFIVNQLAATNINVNAASYIYLSFS